MTDHYDSHESRNAAERGAVLATAGRAAQGARRARLRRTAQGIDPARINSRSALAALPVLRKSDLPARHKAAPPYGGFVPSAPGSFGRLFTSPGPIFEPEAAHADPWRGARALYAAGFRSDAALKGYSNLIEAMCFDRLFSSPR